jgi:F-type H+-transporting ATPase subunit b
VRAPIPSRDRKGVGAPFFRIVVIGIVFAVSAFAQETETSDPSLGWKWANFLILAAGLGYLIRKHAPAYFEQRSKEIRQGISEATQTKQEAEARVAAIEQRLAGLEGEIQELRSSAHEEISAEGGRISRETMHRLQRIQAQSAQEIELMSRAARDELRKYSAQLALDLAEQRIRTRMTKNVEDGLVDAFLEDLRHQSLDARN